jgi:hypothetical protein
MIRKFICCLAIFVSLGVGIDGTSLTPAATESWQVRSSSSLRVNGKTNINSFCCAIPSYERTDTIRVSTVHQVSGDLKAEGKLIIPVGKFDCHHKIMTKDLQKTLRADEYPNMTINFHSFSKPLEGIASGGMVTTKVEIYLAGAKKVYFIDFEVKQYTKKQLELTGIKPLLFSDFGLKPPSKLGGTIKVKNELSVEIKLQVTRI